MEKAWLVNVVCETGQATLTLLKNDNLQPFTWSDSRYRPYYFTEDRLGEETVKKLDLFTLQERSLAKVEYSTRPRKDTEGWEVDIAPPSATRTTKD